MSIWSRIGNVFRSERVNAELDEELKSHLEEALANGRSPEEARRAFGSGLRHREESRDAKIAAWLDSFRADVVFGLRQLAKNRVVSAAAVISLGLAIGSCTAAFRLVDAVLWRPLPIANPERLHVVEFEVKDRNTGQIDIGDAFGYPQYRAYRDALKDRAQMLAISYGFPIDITYGTDQEMERAGRQWVCGEMFGAFGIRPALGRVLTESDEQTPGAHPYVVISYGYWTRRFNRDPGVLGKRLRTGLMNLEIVGVAQEGFLGTEPGFHTDLFIPTMMNDKAIENPNWAWFRVFAKLKPDASREQVRQGLQAVFVAQAREEMKSWTFVTEEQKKAHLETPIRVEPAASGVSGMQRRYSRALSILGIVVILVLLIACANVANLMSAQATSRAREMALRVSIGAGRSRLIQLVLVESGIIALLSTLLGAVLAWWSAPFVVSIITSPRMPMQLDMPLDWRLSGFAVVLVLLVTGLFGIVPALRAAGVRPMAVLKGGEDPHSKRRFIQALTAAQTAFCFIVLFIAGLFLNTFERLAKQPTGFQSEGLLLLETVSKTGQAATVWKQPLERIRERDGVESAAMSSFNPMAGSLHGSQIWLNGDREPQAKGPNFLAVSPAWLGTMKMPLLAGRDFSNSDTGPEVAIVTETFAKTYFAGENPVGRTFERMTGDKKRYQVRIVGYIGDFRYADMREKMRPIVLVPFPVDAGGNLNSNATYVIRVKDRPPLQLAQVMRREVPAARSELRVSNIATQAELVEQHLVRERLLAALSMFFAAVALILAGVGLYGVLTYSMLQRRKEIGIRMALGAKAADVARRVTAESFAMLALGGVLGLAGGIACSTVVESLLFEVKAKDPQVLLLPALVLAATALLAAIPPVIRATRIDPAHLLRSE